MLYLWLMIVTWRSPSFNDSYLQVSLLLYLCQSLVDVGLDEDVAVGLAEDRLADQLLQNRPACQINNHNNTRFSGEKKDPN